MLNYPGHVTLTSWIFKTFLPFFHGDMKILKMLASSFKRFRVYEKWQIDEFTFFEKWQIDDDKGGLPNTTIS